MKLIPLPISAVLLLAIMGCGPKATPIGPGFIYQPDEREQRLWAANRDHSTTIINSGVVYKDPDLHSYVQSVLSKVIGHHEIAYLPLRPNVIIIDAPAVNALSLAHGDIVIHTGILGRIRNEAQLAMLLGHEVSHATHRHLYLELEQKYSSSGAYSYISVLSVIGGSNVHNLVEGLSRIMVMAAITGYSREKEAEADRVGLTLMAQASYDPREGSKMFEAMLDAADKKDKEWNFFYSTHPKMESRVQSARQLLRELPTELLSQANEIGEARYLKHAIKLIHNEVERHVAQGKYALAEKTLGFLSMSRPEDSATFALMGDLYRSRATSGDDQRSADAYVRALTIDSGCANAHKGLGFHYGKKGQKIQAIEHLKAFLEIAPSAADSSYIRQYVEKLSSGN